MKRSALIVATAICICLLALTVNRNGAVNAQDSAFNSASADVAHILPVSGTLWVNNRTANNVLALDPATGAMLAFIPVGARPIGITIPPGTGKVYVANETGNTVSVISKGTRTVITTIAMGAKPHHISHSPDGRFVYVAEFGTNKIGVIDTSMDKRVTEFVAGAANALTHAIVCSRDGRTLYAVNTVSNTLDAIDAQTGAPLWSLAVGNDPNEFVASANGRTGYISLRAENKVKVINLETRAITGEFVTGVQPETLALAPNGKTLIVALRENPAKVSVIDLTTNNVIGIQLAGTATGPVAAHNAISPDGRFSFVAYEGGPAPGVAVIDHTTQTVVTSYAYPGGGQPHGVFYEPAAASVSAASFSPVSLAADSIATAFFTPFFGPGFAIGSQAATTQPLPMTLMGTSVKVLDSAGVERQAQLLFASPGQVNYVMPAGVAPGDALITITSGNGVVSTGLALIAPTAPALFAANSDGQGVAAAQVLRVKADGAQQFELAFEFNAAQNRFVARLIDLGPDLGNASDQVFLILYGTGIRNRSSLSAVTARIGGADAQVTFAGGQDGFAGLDQVNARLSRSLVGRGDVEVVLTVEGRTANAVRVNVK